MNKFGLIIAAVLALSAGTVAAQDAKLTWGATTQYDNGVAITAPVSYNIYQGIRGAAVKTKVTSSTALTVSLTSPLFAGKEICWNITAVVGADESVYSNEACKTFPASKPKAPGSLLAE